MSRFGQTGDHSRQTPATESMSTYCRLMRPISARYPVGLSLRVSARILVSRLAS